MDVNNRNIETQFTNINHFQFYQLKYLNMKTCILLFLTIALISSRRLHSWSFNDIANMPVDALQPAISGDFNSAAQKYAMSKLGLSQSRTIGSYFGKEQPQTPLSGLSSLLNGNSSSTTSTTVNTTTTNPTNQNGFSDLLNRFTSSQTTSQTNVQNVPQQPGSEQGGIAGFVRNFVNSNNQNAATQPQTQSQPQAQGGFSDMVRGFLGRNQNQAGTPTGNQNGGGNFLGRLFN